MPLNHIPVSSSALKSVAYDGMGTLEVITTNGKTYQYGGIPPELYHALIAADSVGRFWNANIKGKYAMNDLTAPPADDKVRPHGDPF